MSSAAHTPRFSPSRHLIAASVAALAVTAGLSACAPETSNAPSHEITYKIVASGPDQKQISAVAYYTAPAQGKDSVRADAGTVMLSPVEGKNESLWQTTAQIKEGQRIELTAAPASSADSLSCVVLQDGNALLSESAGPGQPVTCTNQPGQPARR